MQKKIVVNFKGISTQYTILYHFSYILAMILADFSLLIWKN